MTTTSRDPAETGGPRPAEHFETYEQQVHAARLGMWVFLGSELLLFGALFTLYAGYRASYPESFMEGVRHNNLWLGSINTVILIVSSYFVALSDHKLVHGKSRTAFWLVMGAVLIGVAFLAIKFTEYGMHFEHGIHPGGRGHYFTTGGGTQAEMTFFTLYFITTGAHALHVAIGIGLLLWLAWRIRRRTITPERSIALELGGVYWHLVDIIWIFLWPLYYLTRG